jgi:hypothetical protein
MMKTARHVMGSPAASFSSGSTMPHDTYAPRPSATPPVAYCAKGPGECGAGQTASSRFGSAMIGYEKAERPWAFLMSSIQPLCESVSLHDSAITCPAARSEHGTTWRHASGGAPLCHGS